MSAPVYPNPLGPLDILSANYVNSMVDGIEHVTGAADVGLSGKLIYGPGIARVQEGATNTEAKVFVWPFWVMLEGYYHAYNNASPGSVPALTITGLSSDGFKYVYCYLDGGSVAFGSTDDPPDRSGVWISGETGSKRYLCTVCRAGGHILTLTKTQGTCTYAAGTSAVVFISTGHADRTADISGVVPLADDTGTPRQPILYATVYLPSADTTARPIGIGSATLADSDVQTNLFVGYAGKSSLGPFCKYDFLGLPVDILDPDGTAGMSTDSTVTVYVRGWDEPWNP